MTIKTTLVGQAAILRMEGRMDAESHEDFDEACSKVIAGGAVKS